MPPPKTSAQIDAEIAEALANRQSPINTEIDTEILISMLRDAGVTVSNASTGAIRLPNGDSAFVRASGGKIFVSHPPKGGRAQTYRQTFTSFDRALKAIRGHVR